MKRALNLGAVLLALAAASLLTAGFRAETDPKAALKAIDDYQAKVWNDSEKNQTRVDNAALQAKLKGMAEEAINGVDPDKVAKRDVGAWGSCSDGSGQRRRLHRLRAHPSALATP